jgi:hypothetical protein
MNSGNIFDAINKTVIKGTPLQISIKIVDSRETTGSLDLLPKANMTPMGKDKTIPTPAITSVRNSPPHKRVSTVSKPKPPENIITQIIGKITKRKAPIHPLYLRFGISKQIPEISKTR